MARSDTLFRQLAPRIMKDLRSDFPISVDDAAAVAGNFGHETSGFKKMQEVRPTVVGSRGGYGWPQWTGPRRRAFEEWAKARSLPLNSYEANYGFVRYELQHTETKALPKTSAATTLEAKVIAFEQGFERAGVKHYPSRIKWARIALEAYNQQPARIRPPPKSIGQSREGVTAAVATASGAAVVVKEAGEAAQNASNGMSSIMAALSSPWVLVAGLIVVAGVAIWLWRRQRLQDDGV